MIDQLLFPNFTKHIIYDITMLDTECLTEVFVSQATLKLKRARLYPILIHETFSPPAINPQNVLCRVYVLKTALCALCWYEYENELFDCYIFMLLLCCLFFAPLRDSLSFKIAFMMRLEIYTGFHPLCVVKKRILSENASAWNFHLLFLGIIKTIIYAFISLP